LQPSGNCIYTCRRICNKWGQSIVSKMYLKEKRSWQWSCSTFVMMSHWTRLLHFSTLLSDRQLLSAYPKFTAQWGALYVVDATYKAMKKWISLGALVKLRKETISLVMFVCPSVCLSAWNNEAHTGRIMKFDISRSFEYLSRKFTFQKSDKNVGYFTWRPTYSYENISLYSFYKDKCFTQN